MTDAPERDEDRVSSWSGSSRTSYRTNTPMSGDDVEREGTRRAVDPRVRAAALDALRACVLPEEVFASVAAATHAVIRSNAAALKDDLKDGRAPSGQALVSDEAATHLHPSGFDPSRVTPEMQAAYVDYDPPDAILDQVLNGRLAALTSLLRHAYYSGWIASAIEAEGQDATRLEAKRGGQP